MITPDIGAVIGGLRIDAVAGRGGMGVVYKAYQPSLDRTVAMKIVNPELADDAEFRERFRREARLAASLDHPHVVPIYHAGEDDGNLYLTMRFVDGTDLASMIATRGRVEPRDAVTMIAQVADALDAAHARGMVHRDVKPANILITRPASGWHTYLTDFGISKDDRDAGMTRSGFVVGSLSYISPEQLQGGKVDGRADTYSLACVLYQALTGEVPFPRDTTAARMFAHMNAPPPDLGELLPSLRGGLDRVLAKALAKRPEDRYASAGEFGKAALAAVNATAPPGNTPTVTAPAGPRQGPPPGGPSGPQQVPGAGPSGPQQVPWQQWLPTSETSGPRTAAVSQGWQPTLQSSSPNHQSAPPPSGQYPSGQYPSGPHQSGPQPGPGYGAPQGFYGGGGTATQGSSTGRTWLIVGIAAVVVAALVVGLLFAIPALTAGGGGTTTTPTPTAGALPVTGTVDGQPVKVGTGPTALIEGAGFLWSANSGAGSISKIDPNARTSSEIKVEGDPSQLVYAAGKLWVWNYSSALTPVDATTGTLGDLVRTDLDISNIAGSESSVWFSVPSKDLVGRIDPVSGTFTGETVPVGKRPDSITVGGGRVYVLNREDRTVTTIDEATRTVVGSAVSVPEGINQVSFEGGRLYLGGADGFVLVRLIDTGIAPVTPDQVVDPGCACGFVGGPESVWMWDSEKGQMRRLSPDLRTQLGQPMTDLGIGLYTSLISGGKVWLVNRSTDTVTAVAPEGPL